MSNAQEHSSAAVRPRVLCPHIALETNRASAEPAPTWAHRCFHPRRPARVRLDIQDRFCLSGRYLRCPVYQEVVEAPPGGRPWWKFRDWRHALAFAVFAIVVPGVAGGLLASIAQDDEAGLTRVVAESALDREGGALDPGTPSVPGSEEPSTAEPGGSASADEQAEAEPAAPSTSIERLQAWPDVVEHVVAAGESVLGIAELNGTTSEAIAALNALEDVDTIAEGDVLRVPVGFVEALDADGDGILDGQVESAQTDGPTAIERLEAWTLLAEVEVVEGDALSSIAAANDTSIEAIMHLNRIEDPGAIFAGQTLLVPVGFNEPLRVARARARAGTGAPTLAVGPGIAEQQLPRLPSPADDPIGALLAWQDIVEWEVQEGDSQFALALEFGTTVEAIAYLNGLQPDGGLIAGVVLRIAVGFDAELPEGTFPEPE